MYKQALIVIDYTYDFIAHDGKLACGQTAQQIEPALMELVQQADHEQDLIVLAVDKHEPGDHYHPETRLFPSHNIDGTLGRKLYGELQYWYEARLAQPHVRYMDKIRYSAFAGTDLDIRLRERDIKTITVCGVCTDICVLHTLVDAYNLGYEMRVPVKAVASYNQMGHEMALAHFKTALGAELIYN